MTTRNQTRSLSTNRKGMWLTPDCISLICIPLYAAACRYYLIYFEEDETVSVVSGNCIVELESTERSLEVGVTCHVKEKGKVYKGRVVTHGQFITAYSHY